MVSGPSAGMRCAVCEAMHRLALAVALLALPSLADARPITAGVGVGRIQAKSDANGSASDTVQIYGRVGLTKRLAGQLELQKITLDDSGTVGRTATALLVVDLVANPHLVPTMFAGYGRDWGEDGYGGGVSGWHIEGGFGLEYRADAGFVVSADFRLGGRSGPQAYGIPDLGYFPVQSPLRDGEYRSARLGIGLRF